MAKNGQAVTNMLRIAISLVASPASNMIYSFDLFHGASRGMSENLTLGPRGFYKCPI